MSRLDDTGAFLPFAKKHLVAGRENGDLSTNLKELWPEPDWQVLCDEGMPVDVCAHLTVYYSGWRNHPRPSQPSVTSEQWLEAFLQSVAVLKELLFLNNNYYAFKVLAHLLNIPDSWIGLGGQLGIAFGARGQGGASAHYEPDLNIINLTRRSGPGSISHEWFHAVDALLARTRGFEGRLVSELLPEMNLKDAPDKYRENINLLTGIVTKQLSPSTKY